MKVSIFEISNKLCKIKKRDKCLNKRNVNVNKIFISEPYEYILYRDNFFKIIINI